MDDEEKAEAVRARNAFANLSGDAVSRYELIGDAKETNGLYFLYDGKGNLTEKQYVFCATGLMDFSWLEKIGVNCGLKVGVIGAYNSFEEAWEVGLGAKFTVSSGREWMVIGRIGFKSGKLNTISLEVNSEIPIGPVVFTRIKIGVTGMADNVQTYSPGLGVAFGPEINFGALVSPVAKVLGLKVGSFRVVEVDVSGDVSSDFNDVNLSVEGKLFGLLEIKGGWKRENGNYNEISLSVGTKNSATFNFCVSGSVGWSSDQLTVKGSFDGSFKWDFTALGVTWVGVNVGGGISVVYNQIDTRKTLSVAVNGRAQVKVAFIKVGVNVSKSWFFDLSSNRGYDCINTGLESAERPGYVGERVPLRDGNVAPAAEFDGERLGSYSWTATDFAAAGKMYITVAAQYSLSDVEWVLYDANGNAYTSENAEGVVEVEKVSYSQLELSVENPVQGVWTMDVYGSKKWNGEVLIYAEAGDPIETDLRIVALDKTSVTVEYQAHATGENYLAALYIERADQPEDEYEGIILDYLLATEGDGYRQVTVNLPEDIQGGEYRFYIMAQSTNSSEIAYSAKTEAVEVMRRTADLNVTDCHVELQADNPQQAKVFFTVNNLGIEDAHDFLVEILLGDSEINLEDDLVVNSSRISLAAGTSQEFELSLDIPEDYLGEMAVMSIRLDQEKKIDEGIFEHDNAYVKTLSFARLDATSTTKTIKWKAVGGAVSYDLEYAIERNWGNDVLIRGLAGTSTKIELAPGCYGFRIIPHDANGEIIEEGIQEWNGDFKFSDSYGLTLNAGEKTASTEVFALLDGFYDWSNIDLGNFSGTLMLNEVDGKREGVDQKQASIKIVNGKAKKSSVPTDLLLETGLYYFTAKSTKSSSADTALSFSLSGDLLPNEDASRNLLSLPDNVDENGAFAETLNGWIDRLGTSDTWEYLVEDAGELCLSVNSPETLQGSLTIDLYVQNDFDNNYTKQESFLVGPKTTDPILLEDYLINNNFYLEVHGASTKKNAGTQSIDYSLDLGFQSFEAKPVVEDFLLSTSEKNRVDGWVGYGNPEDVFLLQVGDEDSGSYKFSLSGDAREAYLRIYSITGKQLKSVRLNQKGTASLADVTLYSGDYLVEVTSQDKDGNVNNTDYTLTVKKNNTFDVISGDSVAEVDEVARREKLIYTLDVQTTGRYDFSDLTSAGLKVLFYEAKTNGQLARISVRSNMVNLSDVELTYMKVYNPKAGWGEATIGLDEENRKITYSTLAMGR